MEDTERRRLNREKVARYRARHPDRALASTLKWQAANRDHVRIEHRRHAAAWRARNPDFYRQYVEANRAQVNAIKARHKARRRGAVGSHSLQEWRDKCSLLGNVCIYCGEAKPLERDHNVPPSRGGSDFISNILPACRNCNSAKHDKTAREFLGLVA